MAPVLLCAVGCGRPSRSARQRRALSQHCLKRRDAPPVRCKAQGHMARCSRKQPCRWTMPRPTTVADGIFSFPPSTKFNAARDGHTWSLPLSSEKPPSTVLAGRLREGAEVWRRCTTSRVAALCVCRAFVISSYDLTEHADSHIDTPTLTRPHTRSCSQVLRDTE